MIHGIIDFVCFVALNYLSMVLLTGYWDWYRKNKKKNIY